MLVAGSWRGGEEGRTTVRVPTISRGGSMLLDVSWETKLAVMPTMATMATRLRPRAMRKVLARGAEPVLAKDILGGCSSEVELCLSWFPAGGKIGYDV